MKKLFYFLVFLALIAFGLFYWIFNLPNVNADKRIAVNIPTGSSMDAVNRILADKKVLKNPNTFAVVARVKNYTEVKPGHYVFYGYMNNREVVNILKRGLQTPVNLNIYNIRTKEQFAGLVGRTLETDSLAIIEQLNDPDFAATLHADTANILFRVICTNEPYLWNLSTEKFFADLEQKYHTFWNEDRRAKLAQIGLNPTKATILASIVEKECMRESELATVAGVYMNRLKINMPLQADPTLVFALRDFDAKRVTNVHKEFDSPYNTYLYKGLPPGPICIPRTKSIDAVLNYEQHDYLYFCANPDLSGSSIFSVTYAEQQKVAHEYQRKLNENKIQ